MNKWIAAILLTVTLFVQMPFVSAEEAPVQGAPDAYVGFSVSEDWLILSKNMTEDALLEAADLTSKEVTETLVASDCEYLLLHPELNAEVYVKVKETPVSEELFSITEAEDEWILENLDRMIKEGFLVDQFQYDIKEVTVAEYPQMKYVTVPGSVIFDGKRQGMLLGFTFVNGNGVCFMMHLDTNAISDTHLTAFEELAKSVHFTVIREKGEKTEKEQAVAEEQQSGLQYILGGLAGVILMALLLILFGKMKNEKTAEPSAKSEDAGE